MKIGSPLAAASLVVAFLSSHASASVIAQWELDETSGVTAAATVGPDGTYIDLAATDYAQPASPGDVTAPENAIAINGTTGTGRIELGNGTTPDVTAGQTALTVSMWVNFDNNTADHALLSNHNFGSGANLLWWRDESGGNGSDSMALIIGGQRVEAPAGVLSDTGSWYHLAFTFSGTDGGTDGEVEMFVDGSSVASLTSASLPASIAGNSTLTAGQSAITGSRQLNGFLDEISIYDEVLSAVEIAELADPSGLPAPPSGSIVVDSEDPSSVIVGSWNSNIGVGDEYHGTGFDDDQDAGKGSKSVQLTPVLPNTGTYQVYMLWDADTDRADNVPVTITHAGGTTPLTVDQKQSGLWVLLGTFDFVAGSSGSLLIETTGTNGTVIADAAAWLEVGSTPVVNVTATTSTTTEGETDAPAVITLTRTGPTVDALDVPLAITGTATAGSDYTAITSSNVIPAGESSRTFLITSPSDDNAEGSETVVVTVQADSGYILGANTDATVTIADSAFDLWRAANFSPAELADENVSGANADPDGDGNLNFGEFYNVSNPHAADLGLHLSIEESAPNYLFRLPMNSDASAVESMLTTSIDLSIWQPVPSGVTTHTEGTPPLESLVFTVPISNAPKQFWRAVIEEGPSIPDEDDSLVFWSFDTLASGGGASSSAITYSEGFSNSPVLASSGSSVAMASGGAANFFGPDGNIWMNSGGSSGHGLTWSAGSQNNSFKIDFSTLLQTNIMVRFDVRSDGTSAPDEFSGMTYNTGTGPMPVPDAVLTFSNDGQYHQWSIDLSELDAINSRSSVTLEWTLPELPASPAHTVQIDNVVVFSKGRAKSQLIRNLEAGRLQKVVRLGTSLTNTGSWGPTLLATLNSNYGGLASMVNSGASGRNSRHGVANLNGLVLNHQPDTLFIEYGINDSVERFDLDVAEAETNLKFIVDNTLAAYPQCEIILMTMTPGNQYAPGHTSYRKDIHLYYDMYRRVARERGYLVIDHYSSWAALQANDVSTFDSYVPDTIHPNSSGNGAVVSPGLDDALGITGSN